VEKFKKSTSGTTQRTIEPFIEPLDGWKKETGKNHQLFKNCDKKGK